MTRTVRLVLLALPATLGLVLATPAAASAQPTPQVPGFGQHVAMCAQQMGFDGHMNPGVMHRGAAGWDGTSC